MDDIEALFNSAVEAETSDETTVDDTDLGDDGVGGDDGSFDETSTDLNSDDSEGSDNLDGGFDWTAHKDTLVKVKVDGAEVEVPLAEALNGYIRQETFTRRTQDLAELKRRAAWADQFQEALTSDPGGTLAELQRAFGLGEPTLKSREPETDFLDQIDPEFRPIAEMMTSQFKEQQAKIEDLQRQLESQSRFTAEQQERELIEGVRREMEAVEAKYSDFDRNQVLPIAAKTGLPLEDAYLLWRSKEIINGQRVERDATAEAKRKAAEAAEAKRKAAGTLKGGSMRGGEKVPASSGDVADLFDYFLQNAS